MQMVIISGCPTTLRSPCISLVSMSKTFDTTYRSPPLNCFQRAETNTSINAVTYVTDTLTTRHFMSYGVWKSWCATHLRHPRASMGCAHTTTGSVAGSKILIYSCICTNWSSTYRTRSTTCILYIQHGLLKLPQAYISTQPFCILQTTERDAACSCCLAATAYGPGAGASLVSQAPSLFPERDTAGTRYSKGTGQLAPTAVAVQRQHVPPDKTAPPAVLRLCRMILAHGGGLFGCEPCNTTITTAGHHLQACCT